MAAGKSAGSIFIDLLLDDAKFVSGANKASQTVKKIGTGAAAAASVAATAFSAAGLALGSFALKQIKVIDETAKMARAAGVAVKDFQAMNLVADETGYKFEDIAKNTKLFSDQIQEAKEFNDRFNVSLSETDVSKIEEARNIMGRVSIAMEGIGNTLAVGVAPIITAIGQYFLESGINAEKFSSIVQKGVEISAAALDILRQAIKGVQLTFNALILSIGDLVSKTSLLLFDLGTNIANLLNKIPGVSIEAEDAILDIGLAAKTMADEASAGFDATVNELQGFETTLQRIKKIQDEADKRTSGNNRTVGLPDKEAKKRIDELTKSYEKYEALIKGISQEQLNYQREEAELGELFKANKISLDEYTTALFGLDEKYDELAKKADKTGVDMEQFGKRAAENIQDAFADFLFDPFDQGLKGMAKGFIDTIRRMIAEAQAAQLAKALFGESAGGSGGGFLGNIFGSIFGGGSGFNPATSAPARKPIQAFADGGYLGPGQWGIAGEAGAELLYGGKTGVSVFNQDQIGSKGNTYIIDARGADQGAVARIERILLALAGPGVIEQRVSNAQARGAL